MFDIQSTKSKNNRFQKHCRMFLSHLLMQLGGNKAPHLLFREIQFVHNHTFPFFASKFYIDWPFYTCGFMLTPITCSKSNFVNKVWYGATHLHCGQF